MASMNRVVLLGNLTRDPELRSTPSGTSVANFGLAVNRRWTNRQGEKVDGVDYFNIVVWGKLAELCSDYIRKGSPVALEGRLQSRTWETEVGQKRSVVEVVAENIQFLGKPGAKDAPDVDSRVSEAPPQREEPPQKEEADFDLGSDIPF